MANLVKLKLKKIFLLLGVSLALSTQAFAISQCSKANRPRCVESCNSVRKFSRPICVKKCLNKFCSNLFQAKRSGAPVAGPCQSCMEAMSEGHCRSSCANTEEPMVCRQKCSKLKCEKQCSLLDKSYSEGSEPTKSDCGKCKKLAKSPCSKRCGKSTRPGYTTCMVGCVHESCLTTCYPN